MNEMTGEEGRGPKVSAKTRHVWIVNHYAAIPSKDGGEGRHLGLARHLANHGWTATLFVASTRHPAGTQAISGPALRRRTIEQGVRCQWIRTPKYDGNSGVMRAVNMAVFTISVLAPGLTKGMPHPAVIVGSTVHPFAAWAASRLARRKKVPFVFEIRDVWPETLVDLGKLRSGGLLDKAMAGLFTTLCASAAAVVSPLPGLRKYLDERGFSDTPFFWIPNGVEAEAASRTVAGDGKGFSFGYLGSHGNANALDGLLDGFDEYCRRSKDTTSTLTLIGDGPLKPSLIEQSTRLASRDRIRFEARVPRREAIRRSRRADCLVVTFRDLPVYRYGVSPNKLFDYMLAGRPIILAGGASESPVIAANCGLVVEPDDKGALADAMAALRSMSPEHLNEMGARGRDYVTDHYTYAALAGRLATALQSVSPGQGRGAT
ncbi:MAG: glycosyltransferase family 4 protein [Micrococcales bacterium]|nr:glycosyltransferase family 4 protein [Micrococcales bacterium]